ncbi:MAG: secretin N-terminal domain-containing protein [Acidobacteriota bacterium]|nr:secretin N-terminal domain-containing protein [Acidobacteriota bacterium]
MTVSHDDTAMHASCLFPRIVRWQKLVVFTLAIASSSCATSHALRSGQIAEREQNYDAAVIAYARAIQENPRDRDAQLSLERARLRAAQFHYNEGRRLSQNGEWDRALSEYQVAYEFNPTMGDIEREIRETREAIRLELSRPDDGLTELEALINRTRDASPDNLSLPEGIQLPDSVVFREASTRAVFSSLGQFGGVNILFDPQFRDVPISIDLRNTTFDTAIASVAATTQNFFRITAPLTVTIIPDTPNKRREYEQEIVRTFYLSHADVTETIDLLRLVIDLRRLAPVTATNSISIKDTPERIDAAAKLLKAIDKARPEVVIEVQLLEADRQTLREYGLQFANVGTAGISAVAGLTQQSQTLDQVQRLGGSDVFIADIPSLFMRLIASDTSTRILANPHLRTADGVAATAAFGERVPVPVTTFSPIAAGGVSQQPITSFNYENIGVNIEITPRIHHNDEVSLALDVEISNISGTGFGDLPQFGNRNIVTSIRLRDGETNVLAGLIRDDEREVLEGVPGFNRIPILGRLFGRNKTETQETDIILTLTPHVIRGIELEENDLLPFAVGRDATSGLAGGAPIQLQQRVQPQQQPRALAPGQQPVSPPDQTTQQPVPR